MNLFPIVNVFHHSLPQFNLSFIRAFTWLNATRALQIHDLSGEGIKFRSHTYFLTSEGHGGPPRMSDQPNAGVTSETAQTWKTIHTKHTLSQTNKANMEWWLRRPNDIRGPCGPEASYISYRWGKPPKKPHPGNLCRPGIEPGPAAWQARMLPPAPQQWTNVFKRNLI